MKSVYLVIKQPMDGNCFFHSVAYLLKYYKLFELTHVDLRNIVARYYFKKKKIRSYEKIKRNYSWAETEDVIVLSNILHIDIKIWESANKTWITFGRDYNKKIYIRNIDNYHFDALIKIDGKVN